MNTHRITRKVEEPVAGGFLCRLFKVVASGYWLQESLDRLDHAGEYREDSRCPNHLPAGVASGS